MTRGPADGLTGHRLVCTRSSGDHTVEEHSFAKPTRIRWHEHGVPVIVALLSGHYRQHTRRSDFTCRPGDVLVVPGDERHSEEIGCQHTSGLLIWNARLEGRETLETFTNPRLTRLSHRIHFELHAPDDFAGLALESLLQRLFAAVGKTEPRNQTTIDSTWVWDIEELLRSEATTNWSLNELAACAGVSRSQLCRGFRAQFGCSVGEYLRMYRLERAAEQIRGSSESLTQIAWQTGSTIKVILRGFFGVTSGGLRRDTETANCAKRLERADCTRLSALRAVEFLRLQ